MTQEDKILLLKDLCARLPYGVLCFGITYELDDDGERYIPVKVKNILTEIHNDNLETAFVRLGLLSSCKLETVKPYLRPMSSMTEEEEKEYAKIVVKSQDCSFENSESATTMANDWLLSKGFDVRGLISKELAIEVTEENNPYKV